MLVVVDGVFSMEGDIAPLREICELCERYGARLMVDEAHGAGVLGARGAGSAELLGVEERVDLRMGTFSKSLASCGGFIAGEHEVIEYLRLYSRAFLFTASAVPAALGAALAALRIVRSPEGPPLLERVLGNAQRLRDGLHELGFAVVSPQALPADLLGFSADAADPGARGAPADATAAAPPGVKLDDTGASIVTPIVPVLVGDDWKAALLWKALYDRGRVRQHRAAPRRPPGRRAAAHERDGHARRRRARPRAGCLRRASSATSRPSTGRYPNRALFETCPVLCLALVQFLTRWKGKEKGRF